MGTCPRCGAKITSLLFREQGEKTYDVRLDTIGDLNFEEQEFQSYGDSYVCPECNSTLTRLYDEAVEILSDNNKES